MVAQKQSRSRAEIARSVAKVGQEYYSNRARYDAAARRMNY